MDIGQQKPNAKQQVQPVHRPFARPKLKRRRTLPPRPTAICVRENPTHYVLDFSDQSKGHEKVLWHHVVSSEKRFISLVGLPGCGKTVILRGVAYNRAVQEKLREGIFLVPLSATSTRATLFDNLREVLEKAGFPGAAVDLRKTAAMEGDAAAKAAVSIFVTAVRDKHMLIILDNVSEKPTTLYLVLQMICDLLKRGKTTCRLISSTRSVDVAKAFGSSQVVEITLPEATSEIARAIMCCHAGFDRFEFAESCEKKDNLVVPVLQKCGGLPLALAVAGGAVKRLLANGKTVEEREQIWGHYRTYLCGSFDQFGQISGLYNALSHLVTRVPTDRDWRTELTVPQVMGALAVVPNRVWVPYQVLQRTWGLKRKEDVITVVKPLLRMCLVSRARRGASVGVLVPDIVLEYCRYEAQCKGQTKAWHLKLLKSYVDQGEKFAAVVQVTEDEGGVKWERSADEDEYLGVHLKHHTEEVMRLEPTEAEAELVKKATEIVQQKFLKPLQCLEQEPV